MMISDVKDAGTRNAEAPSGWWPEGASLERDLVGLSSQPPPPACESRYELDHRSSPLLRHKDEEAKVVMMLGTYPTSFRASRGGDGSFFAAAIFFASGLSAGHPELPPEE